MATASAVLSPVTVTCAGASYGSKSQQRTNRVVYLKGMNCYGGLKAHNSIFSLGLPECTQQHFAKVVSSLKMTHRKGRRGGGVLSAQCNVAGEIFKIAAIMNGLVLVGVAIGFVLLRIEASLEESE